MSCDNSKTVDSEKAWRPTEWRINAAILSVNITNGLSASEHVRGVISNSAQTLYALKVLRAHGMCECDTALQTV